MEISSLLVWILVWTVALTILVIVGIVWMLDLQSRLRRLQSQPERVFDEEDVDASLSTVVNNLVARLKETNSRTDRLAARAEQIDAALARTVQGVGLIRFRAFQDTGDQSFALALADGEGNGVVISSLYGRGGKTRLYAKLVQGWLSPRPLGEEEEQALAEARKKVVGNN